MARLALVLLLAVLPSCAGGPTPADRLAQARRIFAELRAILTVGQSVAVARGYLTPDEGDRALRVLAAVQRTLETGQATGAMDGFLAMGDALLDALAKEGRFRAEEIAAFKDLARQLVALVAELQPAASRPGG